MTDRTRTAEIASLVAGGEPTAAIAARYGITPRRVRAIAAATGNAPSKAGRPRTGAATHHTARGRAALARLVELSAGDPEAALELLARLLAIASALGVEPGAVLARLEAAP